MARQAKKQNRVQHSNRKGVNKTQTDVDAQKEELLRRKREAAEAKKKLQLEKKKELERKREKERMELEIKQEDRTIHQMERLLKLNKRRKKQNTIPKSFYAEGLGEILDFLDKRVDPDDDLKDQPVNPDEEESVDLEVEMDEDEVDDFNDDEDESGSEEDSEDEENFSEEDEEESDEEQHEVKTDIYGNNLDKKGRIVKIEKRVTFDSAQDEQEVDKDLLRKIRGQLNRVTSSNLPSISSFIQGFYSNHSLFQVNQGICQCIHDLIITDVVLSPLKLVSELTLLICCLHENVGEEVGGHAIHFFVKTFHSLLHSKSEDVKQIDDKRVDNAVSILCYFYAENLIEVGLFSEIVSDIIKDFSDKTIELLMFILTTVGFIIRKDSPETLKNLIKEIQSKAENRAALKEADGSDSSKRIEFMLETMTAIKNNNILKVTSKASGFVHPIDKDQLKNTLKGCLKKSTKVTPIKASLSQALSSNRWWIKVGSLLENQTKDDAKGKNKQKNSHSSGPESFDNFSDNEEKLCRALRLNTTPLRKSLFKAIITSSDYIEASDRTVSLCKKTQMMEAAYVLLQIAIHEKVFNPFYAFVCNRLALYDRKYKLAIFFASRDRLKELDSMKESKRKVFATLLFHLLKEKVINLSVLNVIDFSNLSEISTEFMKEILGLILSEEEVMKEIFDRIPKKDHQFASSIRLFISCFMDDSAAESKSRDLLKAKIKLGKSLTLDE